MVMPLINNISERKKMSNKKVNIYLEANPNPNSLKFVADYMLVEPGRNYDFPDLESAENAPLAAELLGYDYVRRVFYMSNFVTVTKVEDKHWAEIQDELKAHIKNFLESGKQILIESDTDAKKEDSSITFSILTMNFPETIISSSFLSHCTKRMVDIIKTNILIFIIVIF